MVGVVGFEPTASRFQNVVSNQTDLHSDNQITLRKNIMTKQEIINMDELEFKLYVSSCTTKIELHHKLGVPYNGNYSKLVRDKIIQTNSTFKPKQPKYETITKICPICSTPFETQKDHTREKTTCSYSCANTHFRSGVNHANHQIAMSNNIIPSSKNYQTICFHHHKYECCSCGESRIVEVHHFDHDHNNVNPENLIPLCPTCHQLYHSNYRNDVLPQILEFIRNI